jgi:nucleotide-binding universal stress UspA family protein
MQRILVGFDGSEASIAALRWAIVEAKLRDAGVEAWSMLDRQHPGPHTGALHSAAISRLQLQLAETVDQVAAGFPLPHKTVHGRAVTELVRLSQGADLLVVGARGHGAFTALPLGSVTRACLHGAHCPVTVTRPNQILDQPGRRVVVGIDGSPSARIALGMAADEAQLRGSTLQVVHAVYWDYFGDSLLAPSTGQLLAWGRKVVDAELRQVGLHQSVRSVVVHGHPVEVLTRRSAGASLLVVGSRGHSRIDTLMLGSVSSHCAGAARCPTLITRI